jgi:DNA-binding response OmpR family regulator
MIEGMKKILVIEDEERIVELLRAYLERAGYRVLAAYDGKAGLELFHRERPALVILDLLLPEVDGLDVARRIRQESDVPLIMLTARTEEADRVTGLELGADDYVTKPFSLRELVARVRAVLRRAEGSLAPPQRLERGALVIDLEARQVELAGRPLDLTPTEFDLLLALARHPGRVFSRLQLLEAINRYPGQGLVRTVDTHIKNLRRKLEPDPANPTYIQTVHGVGYRFRKEA